MTEPPNLYDLLGVDRDASAAAIKAAYLWSHKRGAEPEASADQVRMAYEILSDPARRQLYDSTGEIAAETQTSDEERRIVWIMAELLARAIVDIDTPEFQDLIKRMRKMATQNLKIGMEQAEKLDAMLAKLSRAAGRSQTSAGKNQIDDLLEEWRKDLPRMLSEVRRMCRLYEEVLRRLDSYSYRLDPFPDDAV